MARATGGARVTAAQARTLLLARAVEEADPQGALVSLARREEATRVARSASAAGEDDAPASPERLAGFLAVRARGIVSALEEASPRFARLEERLLHGSRVAVPLILALAFAGGAALNALEGGRTIHVLSFPLLGLLLWNLGVYAWILVSAARGADGARSFARTLLRPRLAQRGERGVEATVAARFAQLWSGAAAPLWAARGALVVHLAAILFAGGALAGMYWRGIAVEYRASWESTFLDAESAAGLLRVVLGPASALGGIELPDAAGLRAIHARDGVPENAARWIHLWALTTLFVVVVPRALLAALAATRARRLAADFPLDLEADAALLRAGASERGAGTSVVVVPYSFEPSARERDALRSLLHDVFGNRARIAFAPTLAYGEEWSAVARNGAETAVLVFNAAQSPEQEVHGQLIEEARASIAQVLCLCEESRYQRRLGEEERSGSRLTAARLDERRRAWRRVAGEAGLAIAAVRADAALDDAQLAEVRAALSAGAEARR